MTALRESPIAQEYPSVHIYMTMKTTSLGGLEVSRIGLGAMGTSAFHTYRHAGSALAGIDFPLNGNHAAQHVSAD
ncbi:hypothetical protein NRB20_32770 [Nocardia sp. RB20]|uniref:Uncharacterized protein n=1 Tax=Nocardia macrotermitis TaxID=2585198 RepID=A0A7K0D381_9NOCA|nr:hypothetical protein [Nocardia macrotermitis]